ncbi:MAG: asparagine synthase-related protein, partial [Gemmatimonadota bacterium]
MADHPIARVINLIPETRQRIWNLTVEAARQRILIGDPEQVLGIDGSFALVASEGDLVRLARSLDRPLRYFLAKAAAGPVLIVADRMDVIRDELARHGWQDQFHPSYTRMVPAHQVTTLRLVGCPDPNPIHTRFFDPPRNVLPTDLPQIGEHYIGALHREMAKWLAVQHPAEPIGVPFSGGIDSGAVLLSLYRALLESGQSPSRLKAFTLCIGSGGEDLDQAQSFLRQVDLEMLGEVVEVTEQAVRPRDAVAVLEDYKPLDVECGAVNLALLGALRQRYPEWRLVVDGDGGDENLKDYPIEENTELTIRSVVGNRMLYQEGWGVES